MPRRLRSACSWPGCPNLVDRPGRCDTHRRIADRETKQRHVDRREAYRGDWSIVRKLVLADEPICRTCRRRRSSVVDHIRPVSKGGDPRARANLQALCIPCHNRKTAIENGLGGPAA